MGSQNTPSTGAYLGALADEARRLQREARGALERGDYTHASALIGDAELLAEDVHGMARDIESREMGGLMALAAYDVRDAVQGEAAAPRARPAPPSRRLRLAIGASLAMSLALTEC